MIQLTILKISGYGPWTLTLGSDREHELQMLQAKIYLELQKVFSKKNCLVFLNRADEFFVISNGLGLKEHISIQKHLKKKFKIKMSMSIGHGQSPFTANLKAHEGKKNQIYLDKKFDIFGYLESKSENEVTILHFDVENLTSKRKTLSPFEISLTVFNLYSKMMNFFQKKDSLTFFMGGDNFMVVTNKSARKNAKEFIELVKKRHGITLNCGIGTGKTSREAVRLATKSLDTIREIRDSGKEKPEIYEIKC